MCKRNAFLILVFLLSSVLAVITNVSADFQDDFSDTDYSVNGWNAELLFGKPGIKYLYPIANRLSIHMPDYNTAIYMLNEKTAADDSRVEFTFENVYSTHSAVGLICRYHDYGWYEFRIIPAGQYAGSYSVYKYDQNLKAEGKNPFVTLHPGAERFYSKDINVGLNQQNTLKMICEGDQIRVFINGNEQIPPRNGEFSAAEYADGTSGFSVWTETPRGEAQIDAIKFRSLFEEK